MNPIGVFDSGYGGLTILRQMRQMLPQYDYLYLGDNARAPYGAHSFEVIYRYTLQAVEALFRRGCPLVILACNTASAKALRTIQQNDLPRLDPDKRVLGVIRPTVEAVGPLTRSRHVGLLATAGTVNSGSYTMEINKLWPDITVTGQACPMWVPLVENYEFDSPGADYFVQKRVEGILRQDPQIDTLILGCTHYPLIAPIIADLMGHEVALIDPGRETALAARDALASAGLLREGRAGTARYYVSDTTESFAQLSDWFLGEYAGGPVTRISVDGYPVEQGAST